MKEKDELILFLKIVLGKRAITARNLINSFPQTEATTFAFALFFCINLSFMELTDENASCSVSRDLSICLYMTSQGAKHILEQDNQGREY